MNRKTLIGVAGVALVLAVALGIAFATQGGVDDALAYGPVEVSGTPIPALTDPSSDLAVGMAAPTLTGIDLSEEPITIEPGGTPKILLFLAHWCPHCQAEVPRMVDYLSETGGVEGVDLYGITTSTDRLRTNYPPSAWLERENWQAPVMLDDEQSRAGLAYGVNAFPFWVVLDSDGNVALRLTGELDRQGIEQLFTFASGL